MQVTLWDNAFCVIFETPRLLQRAVGAMARIEIGKYLAADTRVCAGRLIFRGTRILVSDAMELLDSGYSPEAVSEQYNGLVKPQAVREAASFIRRGVVREVGARHAV
jgi:uncharacterized protein (DUF433 family)